MHFVEPHQSVVFRRPVCHVRVCDLDEIAAHLCEGAGTDTPTNLRPRCEVKGMSFKSYAAMFGRSMPECVSANPSGGVR